MSDGTRTHDHRNHNPALYQLSYTHHIQLSYLPSLAQQLRSVIHRPRRPWLTVRREFHSLDEILFPAHPAELHSPYSTILPAFPGATAAPPLYTGLAIGMIGAPERTRTSNPRLRRPMLYPVELRAHEVLMPRYQHLSTQQSWSGQRDLNPRPSAPKADALPDCAMPRSMPDSYTHLTGMR